MPGLVVALLLVSACAPSTEPDAADAGSAAPEKSAPAECLRTPPTEPVACTMEWRPVCGCDGITYPNACSAGAAGISEYSDGECDAERPE